MSKVSLLAWCQDFVTPVTVVIAACLTDQSLQIHTALSFLNSLSLQSTTSTQQHIFYKGGGERRKKIKMPPKALNFYWEKNTFVQKVSEDERVGTKPSGPLNTSKWFIIKWSQLLLLRHDQKLWTLQRLRKRLTAHCEIFFRVLNHINSIRKVNTHGKQTEILKGGEGKEWSNFKTVKIYFFFLSDAVLNVLLSPVKPDIPILNYTYNREMLFFQKEGKSQTLHGKRK